MKENKSSATWYIAATHWLTAGFVVPFIFNLVLIYIATILGGNLVLFYLVTIIIPPLALWLGVRYSASYVNKIYAVRDSKEIALLSTIYLVIVGGGFRLYSYVHSSSLGLDETINLAVFIVGVIIFYISSKTYIKANITNVGNG